MKTTVMGDGAWGTALAMLLDENGHEVTLWGPFSDYIEEMQGSRENRQFLPGVKIPDSIRLTASEAEAAANVELLVLASPSQFMRSLLERLKTVDYSEDTLFVSVAKGIEEVTQLRMSQVVEDVLGPVKFAALSGPSHAEEVARSVPTAVVVASADAALAETAQAAFMNDHFRVYTSDDVIGVELGGSLKNILALASGVSDGMGFGDNSKAAMITRGIVEMARLGRALGGKPETFSGLSGIGDLVVTCTSRHSRNRHVGEELGRGRTLKEIQDEMGLQVAEGVRTAHSAYDLARSIGVEVPIIHEVYSIVYEEKDPRKAVRDLMTREPKPEKGLDFG